MRSIPAWCVTVIMVGLTMIFNRVNDLLAAYFGLVTVWTGCLALCLFLGWDRFIRAKKWRLATIALFILGSAIVLPNILKKPEPVTPPAAPEPPPPPLEDHISLYDPYGGEWGQGDHEIDFSQVNTLPVSKGERRFTPGIRLKDSDVLLNRITFVVKIPKDVAVRYRKPWVLNFSRPEYDEYVLSLTYQDAVTSSLGKHVPESMWLTFSESKPYRIEYSVSGGTGEGRGFNVTSRSFVVDVH